MKTETSPNVRDLWRIISFAIMLFCTTGRAQSIVGHISTPNGVPIAGVLVTGTRTVPFQRVTDTTDASGNYTLGGGLGGLSGSYNVVPSKSGYTFNPASSNVTVSARDDVTADFATPATVPSATTMWATNVTPTSAILLGTVNPNGAATRALFQYGLTTSYGSLANPGGNDGGYTDVFKGVDVFGLTRGTNYHFRITASNSFGVTFGSDATFTTLTGVPSVTTLPPTDGGATTMRLNGTVIPNGANATAWFQVGTATNYEFPPVFQSVGSGTAPTNFSRLLTGLTSGTTYHFRAAASSSFGTNYGTDMTFTPLFSDVGAGLPGVAFSAVAWGDYDNDGRMDFLLTGSTNLGFGGGSLPIAQVWRNTGIGFVNINAGLPGVSGLNNGHGSVAWGDYDNDGKLDILLTGWTGSNAIAQVWRNTGTGFAQDANIALPGIVDGSVSWGDYDNDGRLDILFAAVPVPGGYSCQVWRNTGHGFVNVQAGLSGGYHSASAWGDYDNDGWLDVALIGYSAAGSIFQVWRNTGNQFVNINAGFHGYWAGAVAWGDYDNDGRLDILVEGASDIPPYHTAEIWRNSGSGFSNIDAGLAPVGDGSLAWGDYDNDGRLDALVTGSVNVNPQGNVSQLYHNNGDGTFTAINPGLPAVFRSSVAWADFDNDGRLDILLSGLDKNDRPIAIVFRNNFPVSNTPPSAPSGLNVSVSNSVLLLSWNAAADSETPSAGLTYNVRIGTTPGGSDILAPMAGANGVRRVAQAGNAQERLFARLDNRPPGTSYYWSVQAVDTAFAGSAFAPESSFKFVPALIPIASPAIIPGDLNGDGVVNQNELNTVLSNYWPNSGWLQMTNPMLLNDGFFQFALTNASSWNLSVLVSTNLTDWDFLGPAFPVYQFFDPQGSNAPERFYRLRWP